MISVDIQTAELKGHMRKPKSEGHADSPRVRIQEFSGFLDHLQENTGALPVQAPGPHIIPAASEELWTDPEMCMLTTARVMLIHIGV